MYEGLHWHDVNAAAAVCAVVSLQAARLAGLERQYNENLKDLLDEAST